MNTSETVQNDLKHVWHPFTRFSSLKKTKPSILTRGEGLYLIDSKGNRYLDAISSWWACAVGHNHPRIVSAIQEQAAKLEHTVLANMSHPNVVELASRLAKLMPTPDRHTIFASDGACACEMAMKIALQYHVNCGISKRHKFLTLDQDYHGDTLGTVSVGYLPGFHKAFKPVIANQYTVPLPDYREGSGFQPTQKILETHGSELAGVIVEPLCQGANGMRMYSAQYLRDLSQACKKEGIPLIIDEIAMGFGRTGKMFAFNHAGINPDIVCVGKAVSAGSMPISATIVRDEIYDTFSDEGDRDGTFYHGHTYCGHPIATAACLAALDLYEELDIAKRAAKMGEKMARKLRPLEELPHVKDVRSLGMIGVVELEDYAADKQEQVRLSMLEKGNLIRPLNRACYLMPPLNIEEAELEKLSDDLSASIRDCI